MQISLKEYNKNKFVEYLNKEFIIEKDELNFLNSEDMELIDNVKVKGDIIISNDLITIKMEILSKFKFICSRCLKEFIYNFDLKCSDEVLLNNLDEDIILDLEENLDFTEYIKNYLVINIPQKKVCEVNCLGLCQSCGINLNDCKCDCQNNNGENAFSRLKEVFVNLKEVE